MVHAKQLKSGSWTALVHYKQAGKDCFKRFTSSTKEGCEMLANSFRESQKQPKLADMTVKQAIDGYINNSRCALKPTVISSYEKVRDKNLQVLMDVPLYQIDNFAIQSAVNEELATHALHTVTNMLTPLRSALKMYRPDFVMRVKLPKKQRQYKELPSPNAVLQAVHGSEIESAVLLAMWCSLRLGEIQGLQWSDIGEDGKTFLQRQRTTRYNREEKRQEWVVDSALKTVSSKRLILIPPEILSIFPPPLADSPWVFNFPINGISKRFKRLIRAAGLPDMRFHDCRHLSASIAHALGIPDKYAQERGGWASDYVMKSVYTHTMDAERTKTEAIISGYMRSILPDVT